jgi:glutathione S-transferase
MTAVLYAIPASHPCAAVEHALRLKGVPYRRVEMIPVLSRLPQRVRFGAYSVPAIVFPDGQKLSGSRAIMRALDERMPEPPLLPSGREARARVERAEEWGAQVLQPLARRVIWAALVRTPKAVGSYSEGARLPVPQPMVGLTAPLVARIATAANGASDPMVRADLIGLPTHLGRIDGWIADGTLGGDRPNAADLQIAASLRLLLTIDDVRPLLDDRPAGALARRVFPDYPGHVPSGALPAAWLPAAQDAAGSSSSPAPGPSTPS